LLCEYDALPVLGHGCAHHIQGPAIVGAAEALIKIAGDLPFRLVVYGTPGEEGGGGKVKLLSEGYLRDMDVVLMTHGGSATQTDVKSMALSSVKAVFSGKSAHAALKPEAGRSALDGLLLACHGVEFLREHVRDDTKMHYTILDAGGPVNVVPAVAEGEFVVRSYSSAYLDEVLSRLNDVLNGAAMMSGTTVETMTEKRLEGKVPAYKLNDLLMLNAELVDAPNRKPAREKTGSTDFGNVTCNIPGAVIRVAFVPDGTPSHSAEFVTAGKSREAHDAVVFAAKILAGASFDMVRDPELANAIKREFAETKARS
jgi:amidohydrolase